MLDSAARQSVNMEKISKGPKTKTTDLRVLTVIKN